MGKWQATFVVKAPREVVFDILTDRRNYSRLVPVGSKLLELGRAEEQGVGAVHFLGLGPLGIRERVVAIDPGVAYTYTAVTKLPVRHYFGTMTFSDVAGGTKLTYELDVDSIVPIPGFVFRAGAAAMAFGLGRGAEKEARRRSTS